MKKQNDLDEDKLKQLHEKYDKKDYILLNKEKNIKIVYKLQTISKNIIFYKYQERPHCPGRGKLCLKDETFTVITNCDYSINH